MNSEALFSTALGLQPPWQVKGVTFSVDGPTHNELHLRIGFPPGTRFSDGTGKPCPVHDTVGRQWQHLSFFGPVCYLHCAVPRITTGDGHVRTVEVPWARPGSGFTLLFEALARAADDPSSLTQLEADETSSKKGHYYVTVGVDMATSRVIHATEGKGKAILKNIQQPLESKGVDKSQVEQISMDLSPSFIAGTAEAFPSAKITFDRFHVVKLLNQAMNQVRIGERKEHAALKGHKYTFLRNRGNLSGKREAELTGLVTPYPTLREAYRLKVLFNDLWAMPQAHGRVVLAAMVPGSGCRQDPRLHGVCQHRQGALARDRPVRRAATDQWHPGRHQQQDPTGQAKGQGLSQYQQLHQYDLLPMR